LVFERQLDDTHPKTEAKIEVAVRLIQNYDFHKIAKGFKKLEIKAKERFEKGHMCIVADLRGELVHVMWIAFNEAYAGELERKLLISPGAAYMYDGYTVSEYRGLGIAPKVMAEAFVHLYRKGIRNVYACIRYNNFPSIRYVQKEGFRKIGAIIFTAIFRFRVCRFKGETKEDYNKLKKMLSL